MSEMEDFRRPTYKQVLDRCSEILTDVEMNHSADRRFAFIDRTLGLWEEYGAIMPSEGVTALTMIALSDGDHRVTLTEITRTEENSGPFPVDARLLTITQRSSVPYSPRYCDSRIMVAGEGHVLPAIAFSMETEEGMKQEILSYFYEQNASGLSDEQVKIASEYLDEFANLRPIMTENGAAYVGSFDNLVQGQKNAVLLGLRKQGFTEEEFAGSALNMLKGQPTPLTYYDMELSMRPMAKSIVNNERDHHLLRNIEWDTVRVPREGYPLFPEVI